MSETLFHGDEDDRQANKPADPSETQGDQLETQPLELPSEQREPHPGDPSIEEMIRRALNSGMDDTPPPGEPLHKLDPKRDR